MAEILLLSIDRMLAQRIGDAMGQRVDVRMVQSLDAEPLTRPGVIVMDRSAIPSDRSLAASISAVADQAAGRLIVLATDEQDSEQILHAVRAGARDVIAREAEGTEITNVLSRLLNATIAQQSTGGRLTLVLGVDQEATAMVATDIALIRSADRQPSLLIDCSLPTSAAAAYLDLDVTYGLASAIADIERLDASLLSSALARHTASGLGLLTFDGGTGAEPAGIAPTDIAALVRLLRACSSELVFCAGSLRHGGLLRELALLADEVDIVCAQSIRELEAARRLLDRISPDHATLERMQLLVWDHQPTVLLDGRRMADVLGTGSMIPLPVDRAQSRNALNAGQPLGTASDGGAYQQALRRACGAGPHIAKGALGAIQQLRRGVLRKLERRP